MMKSFLIFIFALMICVPALAQQNITLELAQDRVDITTGFNGTNVVAFGTIDGFDDAVIVVTLKGPEVKMVVRQKERGMTGVWGNGKSVEFRRVLSYYDYADNLEQVRISTNAKDLNDSAFDVESLEFYPEDDLEEQELEPYRDALIRRMQSNGFYPIKSNSLIFYNGNLFKASFQLPPDVPTGTYSLQADVYKDGQMMQSAVRTLQVGQVGFNARVYIFAQENSFLYGIFSILLAVVLGWSAFTFLRRD